MSHLIQVLVVEDLPSDAELSERELRKALGACAFRRVETREDYLAALAAVRPEVIVSDYRLPHFDGMTALQLALERCPDVPFIVLTGSMNEDTAVECMKAGAWDYVIKEHIKRLGPAVQSALTLQRARSERRRSEDAARVAEARYRLVFDHSADAILLADAATMQLQYTNPAACRLFGYGAHELCAMSVADLHPAADWPRIHANFAAFARGEGVLAVDVPCLAKDGRVVFADVNGAVIASGAQTLVAGFFRDTTERRRAERALADSRAFTESLLRTIPFPMNVVDEDGHVLFMNDALRGLVGPEPVGERCCWMLFKDDRTQCAGCPLVRGIARDQTEMVERVGLFGGRTVEVFHAGMSFQGKRALLEVFHDVTEQRALQAQLAQADRLSTMGTLAAGVAHEINNPLSYILYNLESLSQDLPCLVEAIRQASGALRPQVGAESAGTMPWAERDLFGPAALQEVVSRLRDALAGTHRIKDITRGLGTFSRVERTEVAPVDLHHAIEHAVTMAFNEIKYRARLVKDFGPIPMVLGSDGKIAQVFLNLLINAGHAIGEGHVDRNEVRIRTWAEGDHVFAKVSDTGAGIAPAHRDRIFEPFFTTKGVGVGTGLGLSICKTIVTGFGGEISVTSEEGKGTQFLIRLPRLPSDWGTQGAAAAVVEEPAPVRAKVRGRILVIDDEREIRAVLVHLLRREHEVVTAASGREAQALLETDRGFDVIFCDLMMPEMTGMELHAWLSGQDQALADQVVFITGGGFTPSAAAYLREARNVRVEKPFDMVSLRTMTAGLVRAARAR